MLSSMGSGWKRVRRRSGIWFWMLLVLAVLAVLFHGIKGRREWMDAWASAVSQPWKQSMGWLASALPFSVAEVLIAGALAALALFLICAIWDVAKSREHAVQAGVRGIQLAAALLAVYVAYLWLWTANYYTTSLSDITGIPDEPVTVEQLEQATLYFVDCINKTAGAVQRDESGCFTGDREQIFSQSAHLYEPLEQQYPQLAGRPLAAKPVFCSELMSRLDLTGFFFPLTGEANVNVHSPLFLLPSTIAHELAHQRGVAQEQEANFAAVMACLASGIPEYVYSGSMLAYIHLSNALRRVDGIRWENAAVQMDERAWNDLEANDAYWKAYDTPMADVGSRLNDTFLKSNGQQSGTASYGAVVHMLCAWVEMQR